MARNPLLILLLLVAAASAALPVFHGDAQDKVTAGFKKRGRQGTDYNKITVDWSLIDLVENIDDLDTSQSIVEVKAGDGAWVRETGVMKRGTFKATVKQVAPCKSHEVRFVVVSKEGEEATSPFTVTVDPATPEQIEASRFTPKAPTNLVVSSLEGNKIEVSWDASECATHYEIFATAGASTISGNTEGETSVVLEAESCEQYEIAVTAYTGEEASDEAITDFSTSPSLGAAEKLEISVESDVTTAEASWNGWELSCVADYAVQLCKDGACEDSVAVKRDSYGGQSVFAPETVLEECSEYTLKVKPIFEGLDLPPKEVTFTTKAPLMVHVEAMLGEVTAEAGDSQMVTINWSKVKCAATYTVYQKQSLEGSDWEEMEKIDTHQLTTQGVPCTQYNYGVTVTINGEESEMVETDEVLVIPMDTDVPFHPSSLHMNPTENGLTATWEHAHCITAYRVEVCEAGTEDCVELPIDLTATHEQEVTGDSLKPCTDYTMKIFATSNEVEMDAEVQSFTTKSPAATPPADLTAELNPTTGKIDVAFSPVQCASKYKIFRKLDDGELLEVLDTSATTTTLEAPEPCTAFSIGASSLIGEEESAQSELVDGLVPAQSSEASSPKLLSVTAENNTVEFIVDLPEQNQKCQVKKYEVKYISLGAMSEQEHRSLDPSEMAEDGTLVIEDFPGAADKAMRLEARILYSDGVFSPWISSKEPSEINPPPGNPNGLLVPIVIGILLAVVVLLVVIFFIVKRRRSQSKYDPENAQNGEESKQLNPEV